MIQCTSVGKYYNQWIPKLHHNTGEQESIKRKETDASKSSHPINLLKKVSTLFRKSSNMQEQVDISSFRPLPLSSFSPTYVSGGEKKRIEAETDKYEPVRSFLKDAFVQSLSQSSLHLV
jgi:hypothetical protein